MGARLDRFRYLIAKPASLVAAAAGLGVAAVGLSFAKRQLGLVRQHLLVPDVGGVVPVEARQLLSLLESFWAFSILLGAAVFLIGISLAGVCARVRWNEEEERQRS